MPASPAVNALSKQQLRQQLRSARRALPVSAQQSAARGLLQQVRFRPVLRRSLRIAIYMPADGEISPLALLPGLWRAGKQVYLPRITAGGSLTFHRFRPGERLSSASYGILEPDTRAPSCRPADLDLVLMPMVGFDRRGTRLGMGGGYYDRAFRRSRRRRTTVKVGLAHSVQETGRLPRDPWDRRLDFVATEAAWLRC